MIKHFFLRSTVDIYIDNLCSNTKLRKFSLEYKSQKRKKDRVFTNIDEEKKDPGKRKSAYCVFNQCIQDVPKPNL